MDVPSHVPHLSNEILARIIEFLEGDLESLKACSVTCHSFLYPARKHIFHHVHITIRNCAKFLQFLDANTNLGVHVRELHIVASNPMEQEVTWVDKYLPLLAPKLPNVVHLELKGKDRYKSAPFRGFQSVKRLTIERTQVNNLNDFCALTGMFPRLEETWCHDLFVYRILTDEVTAEAYNPPRNLRITHFSDCRLDPAQYVDWMVKHDLYRNLEHFSSCPLQQVGLPAVGKIAKAAGPALKWWKLAMVGMVTQGGFVAADWIRTRTSKQSSSAPPHNTQIYTDLMT
ncbi:hypothetical protein BDW22DRAFT_902281 [Trametopsis cervina]|nr:hypothetical protein BDW22DRAFT_902281 [Trametopsis cervina]